MTWRVSARCNHLEPDLIPMEGGVHLALSSGHEHPLIIALNRG